MRPRQEPAWVALVIVMGLALLALIVGLILAAERAISTEARAGVQQVEAYLGQVSDA